jgi:DNA-binding MarR family transcriptional regulator
MQMSSSPKKKSNGSRILTLDRFLPYRVATLSNRISGIIAQTYKDKFALSVTEWRIMAVLGERPGASADEVSAKIQIEKSIVSRSLQKLLKRHLVVREVDESDRRRHNLTLTKTGKDVYRQIVPVSYDYEDQLLTCFNQHEREQFDKLVDRLYEHAASISLED